MIFEELGSTAIDKAIEFATKVHAGQTRRNGSPYINHCLAVRDIAKKYGDDEVVQVACILHDTIEDGDNPDMIGKEIETIFGNEIATIVRLLTHDEGVEYNDYVYNMAKSGHGLVQKAFKVKMRDMENNLYDSPGPKQFQKYKGCIEFLLSMGIDKKKIPNTILSKIGLNDGTK